MDAGARQRIVAVLAATRRLPRTQSSRSMPRLLTPLPRMFNVDVGRIADAARSTAGYMSGRCRRAFCRRLIVGPVVAFVVLAAGCSANESHRTFAGSSLPSPSSPTSLGPSAAAARDALVAYRGMWSAFVEAGKTSDPDAPDLRRYASDQALRLIVGSLVADREQTKITKGDLVLDPKVSEVTPVEAPAEVTVLDCVDSTRFLKYRVSGQLWDDKPGGRHRTTATVKVVDGTWKVSAFILEELGTC